MEHYNKYYLVRASEFDSRRAKPPPTSYGEQRRHDIEHSYRDLLKELTNPSERVFDAAAEFRKKAQSALTEGAQDSRRRMLPRATVRPPSPQPAQQQPTSEERAESPAGAKATVRRPRSVARRTPKQQRAARNELHTLLSPMKTSKKGKKQKKKATEKSTVVTRKYWR